MSEIRGLCFKFNANVPDKNTRENVFRLRRLCLSNVVREILVICNNTAGIF